MKKLSLLIVFMALCSLQFLHAQSRQITGLITSAQDNAPLPGATVTVKGTSIGAISDVNGNYTINVPEDKNVLVFNFVGMKAQEVEIGDRTRIDVALELDAVGLDEVMVVAYNTIKRADFTGSAQMVEGEELQMPGAESIDKSLIGKVSGVRVSSTTGDPGSSGEIQIRGIGSINGSTSPLYVIDGIPMLSGDFGHYGRNSNILSTINPDDIANITILKDAAAASLYGSRAANGVVIITTKQGRAGKTKFEFKTSQGWSSMASNSYEMMGGPEYHRYEQLAIANYIKGFYGLLPGQSNYGNADSLAYYQPEIEGYQDAWSATIDSTVSTDWRDVIYRTGSQRDYQLSASGGNEKTRFYIGGGYTDIKGLVANSDFKRYSGRINVANNATDWLNLNLNQMLSFTQQNGYRDQSDQTQGIGYAQPLGILFAANPTAPKYNEEGETYPGAHFAYRGHPEELLTGDDQFIRTNTYRSITNGSVEAKFTDYLSFKSTAGIDWVQAENFEYWGPNSVDGESTNGRGEYRVYTNLDLTSSNVLTFDQSFGNHNLQALAGAEISATTQKFLYSQVINYSNSKLVELGNGQPDGASSSISNSNLLSYFSNVMYNYDNRYYLSGSVRTDGSSRLGVDNRWATFWSGSASWRFSGESALENSDVLTDGKLRFSYGTNGNLPPFWYEHLPLYAFDGGYGENPAIYVDQPGNDELGWEKSNNMNVGLDINLFGRFGFVVEYYDKLTEGLLLDRPITYMTGFGSTWQNIGSIRNNGLEFELHTVNIASPDGFTWRTDLTLTSQKSVVKELPDGEDLITGDGDLFIYSEGEDMYSFYLPTWVGVDPETGYGYFKIDPELPDSPENRTRSYFEAGRSIVGKAYPDILGGFNNSFSYKGINVDLMFTYSFGGNMFDYPGYFTHHDGLRIGVFNLAKDVEGNYWTKPGDEVDNPMPNAYDPNRPDRWSTRHILSTDYVRLKELKVGYTLPTSLTSRIYVDNLEVYVKGTNLWMWTKEKDIDPEVTLNGYRTVDTPLARMISVGVNLGF